MSQDFFDKLVLHGKEVLLKTRQAAADGTLDFSGWLKLGEAVEIRSEGKSFNTELQEAIGLLPEEYKDIKEQAIIFSANEVLDKARKAIEKGALCPSSDLVSEAELARALKENPKTYEVSQDKVWKETGLTNDDYEALRKDLDILDLKTTLNEVRKHAEENTLTLGGTGKISISAFAKKRETVAKKFRISLEEIDAEIKLTREDFHSLAKGAVILEADNFLKEIQAAATGGTLRLSTGATPLETLRRYAEDYPKQFGVDPDEVKKEIGLTPEKLKDLAKTAAILGADEALRQTCEAADAGTLKSRGRALSIEALEAATDILPRKFGVNPDDVKKRIGLTPEELTRLKNQTVEHKLRHGM